jgi:hypothetical protein
MSQIFARYVVTGDKEDMLAFESILRHIDKCKMLGESRDITISVDGDGSASLRFYRNNEDRSLGDEEMDKCSRIEYLEYPDEIRKKLFKQEEDVNLGTIGVMKSNGDGHYYIGE